MSSPNIEVVVQRLSSADSGESRDHVRIREGLRLTSPDVKVKAEAAAQLRDNLEHYINGPYYAAFLKKLIPIFLNCLHGPPVFISTSPEQVCNQAPTY